MPGWPVGQACRCAGWIGGPADDGETLTAGRVLLVAAFAFASAAAGLPGGSFLHLEDGCSGNARTACATDARANWRRVLHGASSLPEAGIKKPAAGAGQTMLGDMEETGANLRENP